MTGKYSTLKTRLVCFTGTIVLLFIIFFIFQYNNYFFTRQTISYQNQVNKTLLVPGKLKVLHEWLKQNDFADNQFYASEKSVTFDSVQHLLAQYQNTLDSITHAPFLSLNKRTIAKAESLKTDCKNLSDKYIVLKQKILDRGLYTTGRSGEFTRFGNFLEELAASYNNPSLITRVSLLGKAITEYQRNKTSEKIQQILDQANALKIALNSPRRTGIKGLSVDNKLKFLKELESFSALAQSLQKADAETGLIGKEGAVGEVELLLDVVAQKSAQLQASINADIEHKIFISFLVKSLLIIILTAVYLWFLSAYSRLVRKTIDQIKIFASDLVQGKLPAVPKMEAIAELSVISQLFSNFLDSLRDKIRFASRLEAGDTSEKLLPLSKEDTLANALLDMEKSLKKAAEEDQKYKAAEQKRAWANEGLAKFSEILRIQTDNLSSLSDKIISNLVKYLKANQGGIFSYNDDNEHDLHLELISAFAFDRKKHLKKRIEIGEGLVGTCAQEKQTIFITDIPENYFEITSGLGEAPPRSLLIVPLKTEKQIFGILEIASFSIFETYEIEFVEKLAQSIASTFASVKININTTHLLEQSKRQAEEMAQQEEEMRQSLEELQATQEESARREAEINSLAFAVDSSALVVQVDMEGRVIEANRKFATVVKMRRDELIGRYLKGVFVFDHEKDEFYKLLQDLKQGRIINRTEEVIPDVDSGIFLEINYSPIVDHDGRPYKVLGIATDVTGHRKLEQTVAKKEKQISELDFSFNDFKSLIKQGFIQCEISPDCTICEINNNYTDITGYNPEELIGKDYRKFLRPDELDQFEIILSEVLKDKTYKGVIKRTKPTKEESWLIASFIPLKDSLGNITGIYILAQDITEKKLKYQVLEDANKEIERLKNIQGKA